MSLVCMCQPVSQVMESHLFNTQPDHPGPLAPLGGEDFEPTARNQVEIGLF